MNTNKACKHCIFHKNGICCSYRSLRWCLPTDSDYTCDYFTPFEEESINMRREVEEQLG